MLKASDFGEDFLWGVATAAAQIEGAAEIMAKGCRYGIHSANARARSKTGQNLPLGVIFIIAIGRIFN